MLIFNELIPLAELKCRMAKLVALRRAVCVLNASHNWPKGSRRRQSFGRAAWLARPLPTLRPSFKSVNI